MSLSETLWSSYFQRRSRLAQFFVVGCSRHLVHALNHVILTTLIDYNCDAMFFCCFCWVAFESFSKKWACLGFLVSNCDLSWCAERKLQSNIKSSQDELLLCSFFREICYYQLRGIYFFRWPSNLRCVCAFYCSAMFLST